jgi:hypothetical protein
MKGLEKYRGNDGIIDLNQLNIKLNNFTNFYYDGKQYFIKWSDKILLLNELVAAEIAKDFGISSVRYAYARCDYNEFFNGDCVISECAYRDNDKVYDLSDLVGDKLTLEDIWNALEIKYKDYDIVSVLMDEIVNVFLFDILIANDDRHSSNFFIVENEIGAHVAPLFDNEYMLCDSSIDFQYYSIKVDGGNPYYRFIPGNLSRFLQISDKRYLDRLKSKLWIITPNNLDVIFERIEKQTGFCFNENYKEGIKEGFKENHNMIEEAIKKPMGKRL